MNPRLRPFAAPVTVLTHPGLAQPQVVLLLCCIMHAIHDGYTSAMTLAGLPLSFTILSGDAMTIAPVGGS